MSIWVIIPVKPLKRAKSRLAGVLTPEQRYKFAEAMLRQMLQIVASVPEIAGTLVVSRDSGVLSIAREYGAKTVQESGTPELNPALMRATQVVRSWGCEAVLILPADLPFITRNDIMRMVNLGRYSPSVVVASDRYQNGTNALLVRPPTLIDYAYGEGSFKRHIELAREANATISVCESERLLLDVDDPEDLERYNHMVQAGNYDSLPVFPLDSAN